MSSSSANEDDPCSSGEDWRESEKKRNKRRLSTRLSKKPRLILAEEFTSEEEDSDEDFRVKRNGGYKKPKVLTTTVQKPEEKVVPPTKPVITLVNQPDFTSGSFVILKKDASNFTVTNPPHIWRIDGKALLQKFEPFKEDGELKYKNTSVYTGWSIMECDKYAPLKDVNIIYNSHNKLILTFDWSRIRQSGDSD